MLERGTNNIRQFWIVWFTGCSELLLLIFDLALHTIRKDKQDKHVVRDYGSIDTSISIQ